MKRNYEGLFILNTAGKEESSKELIEKLEKEIQHNEGKTLKIERMEKRPFARVAGDIDSGYYVNIGFEMPPEKLVSFREKLKLDEDIFRAVFFKSGDQEGKKTKSREKKTEAA